MVEKKTFEERKKEIDALFEEVKNDVAQYFRSEDDLKALLSFKAQFYNYSLNNTLFIQRQFPGAIAVGSYAFLTR